MILCDTNILVEFYKNNSTIIKELRLIGLNKLTIPDALIASTALVHQLELYTLNLKDFRFITGLNLYNPIST
jgi:predicted nucleic acid-binding protein